MIYCLSYLSLIVFIMSGGREGILSAAIFAVAGLLFFALTRPKFSPSIFLPKLYPVVGGFLTWLGYNFYIRRIISQKVAMIAEMLHMKTEFLVLIAVLGLCVCASIILFYIFYNIVHLLDRIREEYHIVRTLLCTLLASILTVGLAQIMIGVSLVYMGFSRFCWGVAIVCVLIMVIYCILGRMKLPIILGSGFFVLISIVNAYVYQFRERLFEPVDIFSAKTAMNVAGNYSFWPIPTPVLVGVILWIGFLLSIVWTQPKEKAPARIRTRLILAVCCVAGIVSISRYTAKIHPQHWQKQGASLYGYVLDFTAKIREARVSAPEGYSQQAVLEICKPYTQQTELSQTERPPHIIVIMDEAFSDLSLMGEFKTDKPVTPFISSLTENVVSGYALASIHGGNTVTSEFEFLTGNSLAWLSPSAAPYQQYIRDSSYSMVSYLKTLYDYQCIAMHPYLASGWARPQTYKHFGFDESLFLEAFPQSDLIRGFVSDREMFDMLIDVYEEQKEDPLFLFGVTMQNHGPYYFEDTELEETVSIVEPTTNYVDVEQFLSLLHETDKAVEYLISYFSQAEDDVVIVFFGDHQPRLDNGFFTEIAVENSAAYQSQFKVPFFIWTNFDSDEKQMECISLSNLSSYVYESAGIPLPPYNRFLCDMEKQIPTINVHGFYSLRENRFISFANASEEEKIWLQKYEMLQYNNLFDAKNRNKDMFVILE